jgi:hypothetical protein
MLRILFLIFIMPDDALLTKLLTLKSSASCANQAIVIWDACTNELNTSVGSIFLQADKCSR